MRTRLWVLIFLLFFAEVIINQSTESMVFASPLAPPGFTITQVVTGLNYPTDMIFLPTGDILVAEKGTGADTKGNARVRLIHNGILQEAPVITFSANVERDSGLLGIAVDPDFTNNHYFYVWYAAGILSPGWKGITHNRLARFTFDPETGTSDPASYTLILEGVKWSRWHNGGGLRFSADGMLYIATGDANQGEYAQDASLLNGKLLRIHPTSNGYEIPEDNPFRNTANVRPEIFALGLRNPFRMTNNPADNQLYLGDVGADNWEEIDVVKSGADYGWNQREGPCGLSQPKCSPAPASFTDPVIYWGHKVGSAATGLAFYSGNSYPLEYQNHLFFVDYSHQFIAYADFNNAGFTIHNFLEHAGAIVDLEYYNNAFYALDIVKGRIIQIAYTGSGNRAPVAVLTADSTFGPSPHTVKLSASGSFDNDDSVLRYHWNLGDGTPEIVTVEPFISHTYNADNNYTVELKVVDLRGGESLPETATIVVYSGEMPTIELRNLTQVGREIYQGGDQILYQAARKNGLAGLDSTHPYAWRIDLHHDDHIHPEVIDDGVISNTYTIPTDNHGGATKLWYRFNLSMFTATGQQIDIYRDLQPALRNIALAVEPNAPAGMRIDGIYRSVPGERTAIVGTTYELEALPVMLYDQAIWSFTNWTIGQNSQSVITATLPITVADDTITYTAHYTYSQPALVINIPMIHKK